MPATLLLDTDGWDLVVDLSGNIAVAGEPYSFAQDAASAIKTFRGELYYNKAYGVPYFQMILGKAPPPSLMKSIWVAQAKTVPGVVSAKCFIKSITDRSVHGQVQVTDAQSRTVAAGF